MTFIKCHSRWFLECLVATSFVVVAIHSSIGCGSSQTRESSANPETTVPNRRAIPRIQSVNVRIPVAAFGAITNEVGGGGGCLSIDPVRTEVEEENCAVEEQPPPERPPATKYVTAIATLRPRSIEPPVQAVFIVFESRGHGTCFDIQLLDLDMSGGVPLACNGGQACRRICLMKLDVGKPDNTGGVLVGTVAADAEALRIFFSDGSSSLFLNSGPLVRGMPDQRVFMIDLGSKGYVEAQVVS
jgi:hypothetical protein